MTRRELISACPQGTIEKLRLRYGDDSATWPLDAWEKILQTLVARTPLGRMGKPEDIANAYAWLASAQASFVSGEVLSVDGGAVTGT